MKSNLPGFSRGSTSKSHEVKKVKVENQEIQGDSIDKITQLMKQMEVNHANQLATMQANQTTLQNKVITLERNKGNNFHQKQAKWLMAKSEETSTSSSRAP